ncbi:nucleoside deaminase [candidate division CSSED10-310 bacterium]|uniref:Nucleoside deaminase n=1 Tax=candidate division CSSED10-310 bacterium TaxID=2855610 RepID=A0ABV6Z0X8_UNCC1
MTHFNERVSQTIDQLNQGNIQAMASELTRKRMSWLDEALPGLGEFEKFTPRQAFELLFFEHMRLKKAELPVISESEKEIVWLSYNRCSLLEACLVLEMDTRNVCRAVNEKATQAFLSRVNPELRFHRSYEEIRPDYEFCREKIVRLDFNHYMRLAIQEAQRSRDNGNKGYGAVVVYDDHIIGQAFDTAITARDPSLHAEVNAIRQAVKTKKDDDLCGAVLFSTCEPCPMCSSLAVWANITTIVYGVSIAETARLGKSRIEVSAEHIIENSPVFVEVVSNILSNECRKLYLEQSIAS